eukprot:scaffold3543_cov121-Cylindrotheca_fusiformis.AAC.3
MHQPNSIGRNDGSPKIWTNELFTADVLLGRGTGPNEHVGNCIFREEVERKRAAYASSSSKAVEEQIIDEIIASVYRRGGRFLKKLDSRTDPSRRPLYEVVFEKKVLVYKIKQAIRYSKLRGKKTATPDRNRKAIETPSSSGSTSSRHRARTEHRSNHNDLQRANSLLSAAAQPVRPIEAPTMRPDTAGAMGQSSALPLSDAERLMLLSNRSDPFGLSPPLHNNSNFWLPPTAALRNQAQNADQANTSSYLDHLALLHLQKVDPITAQLVVKQQMEKQQQALQLGNMARMPQPGSFSSGASAAGGIATSIDQQQQLLQISSEERLARRSPSSSPSSSAGDRYPPTFKK